MRVWLISFISGLGGGVLSWFLADFVTRPIRRFRELRTEAKTLMILLWNAPESGRYSAVEWLELMEAFKESRVRLDAVAPNYIRSRKLSDLLRHLSGYSDINRRSQDGLQSDWLSNLGPISRTVTKITKAGRLSETLFRPRESILQST